MIVGVEKELGKGFVKAIGLFFVPEKPIAQLFISEDDDVVCRAIYDAAIKNQKIEVSIRSSIIAIRIKGSSFYRVFNRTFKITACEGELRGLKKLSLVMEQKKCFLAVAKNDEGISLRFMERSKQKIKDFESAMRQTKLSRFHIGVISDFPDRDNNGVRIFGKTSQLPIS
jgi:hypothetical protein